MKDVKASSQRFVKYGGEINLNSIDKSSIITNGLKSALTTRDLSSASGNQPKRVCRK